MADAVAIDIQQNADGSVVVNLDTHRPASKKRDAADKFSANLAEPVGTQARSEIANELLEGIDADITSRAEWVSNYNRGMELLGLRIEDASKTETQTSTVRHPELLWSIVKFQSLAQAELLPSNGPAKVRNDGDLPAGIAEDLQRSINYYLTVRASEYYPDTDRGLFYLGYGGTIYKKVYRCPVRQRPVSECVFLPDLIVSQDATDLQNAQRVTHRIEMLRQTVLKYQRLGWWRDVQLPEPTERIDSTDTAEAVVTGIAANRQRREDWPYSIYECYTTLDLGRWGHGEPNQDEGVELPYRVTLDRDSREILEIRRNWRQDDKLRLPRRRFVKWGLIPGIGFLALGYLHLIGNNTRAMTALVRILIDAGIFANFPAGVRLKGTRLENNVIRPAPGEFPEIDAGGADDIAKTIMPLPFKGPMAENFQLLEKLEEMDAKVTGAVEIPVGEGMTNVPVGTIIAAIEQASQTIIAVHKRLHQAQGEELTLLRELLIEQPELLHIPDSEPKWSLEQLASASLVPASDPNIPSHIHRIMQAMVLEQLSTAHPEMYNQHMVQRRILQTARISEIDEILMPISMPQGQGQQDPTAAIAAMTAQLEKLKLAQKEAQDARNAKLKEAEIGVAKQRADNEATSIAAKTHIDSTGLDNERQAHLEDLAEQAADRVSREKIGMKEIATSEDQAAADREAQMNVDNLNAVIDHASTTLDDAVQHRGLDIQQQQADTAAAQPAPAPKDTTK